MNKPNLNKNSVKKLEKGNNNLFFTKTTLVFVLISVILTYWLYANITNYAFLNWDDPPLVTNNEYVTNFFINFSKNIFELDFYNRDPLTLFSHALAFKFFKDDAGNHHLINLMLHIFNGFLLYLIFKLLSKNGFISAILALVWLIHPLRVESVAWVAERKDVLYTFFIFLGIFAYINYLNKPKNKYLLVITFVLFIFSLLSKFAAIVFPFILLIIDYTVIGKYSKKSILEKIPFVFVVILAIILHFSFEQSAIDTEKISSSYPFITRIAFAAYAFSFYLIKVILPFELNAFFPYPDVINGWLPISYYLSCLIVLFILIIIILLYLKKKPFFKPLLLGVIFFIVNISLVLHIIPIGGRVIVAERYTYLASVGLYLSILLIFSNNDFMKLKLLGKFKMLTYLIILIYIGYLSVVTKKQTRIWENTITLWSSVIDKNPSASLAYYNRGHERNKQNDKDGAIEDFNKAIALRPDYVEALTNRGQIYLALNNIPSAYSDFMKAYQHNPTDALVNNNLGYAIGVQAKYTEALPYFNRAIELDSLLDKAYYNRGVVNYYMNNNEKALIDLNKAIAITPFYYEAYLFRGLAYLNLGKHEKSINDFSKAIEIKPDYADAYLNRGYVKLNLKQYNESLNDFSKAIQINPSNHIMYSNRGSAYFQMGNFNNACTDWKQAKKLGNTTVDDLILKFCK